MNGGTSGIITIEDIVEELLEKLKTRFRWRIDRKELGDDTYIFSARFDVEYLNQTYKLNIPESDSYGTLVLSLILLTISVKRGSDRIGTYHLL
jgi:CBS domain containing-hemolysin-like protein